MPNPLAVSALFLASVTAASSPVAAEDEGLGQVSITGRIVIRVESAPSAMRAAAPMPVWQEKNGPKCIATKDLAGAIVTDSDSVDLVLKGGLRLRAQLDDDCDALGYYGGFYLKTAADGKVCAGRDTIRTRTGDSCSIGRFSRLVAKQPKRRKP